MLTLWDCVEIAAVLCLWRHRRECWGFVFIQTGQLVEIPLYACHQTFAMWHGIWLINIPLELTAVCAIRKCQRFYFSAVLMGTHVLWKSIVEGDLEGDWTFPYKSGTILAIRYLNRIIMLSLLYSALSNTPLKERIHAYRRRTEEVQPA